MSDLPNGIPALIEKKLQEERKLIAEWLRALKDDEPRIPRSVILTVMAGVIERAEEIIGILCGRF